MGMGRTMSIQADCFPTTSNYSTTPATILNYIVSQMSPSALFSMGFIEIWHPTHNRGSEPTTRSLELAQYTVATVPRMGWGFTGGIRVQVAAGNIAGSVCATGTVQNPMTAITLCNILNVENGEYSKAAFFKGAVVDGGFIAIANLSSSQGMLQASIYNNFTYKGDSCTHAQDLGIICGADTFTTTNPDDVDMDVVYTVMTSAGSLIPSVIQDVSLGLIPASIVTVTTGPGSSTFRLNAGNMGFTKHDLNGVLQSMSPLLWTSVGASVSWNINVTFKPEPFPGGPSGTFNPSGSYNPSGEPGVPEHIDAYLFTAIVTPSRTISADAQLKMDFQMYHNISSNRIMIHSTTNMLDFSKVVFYFVNDAETCPTTYGQCNEGPTPYNWMHAHHLIIANSLLMMKASWNLNQLKIVQLWSNASSYPMGPSMASGGSPMLSPSKASFVIGAAEYSPYSPGNSGEAPRIGHIKLQLEPNTMWGSVCASGTMQESAKEVCKWLFPTANITVAAFFTGASAQGFIAASGLMMSSGSSAPALHATATSNFTQINTGSACTHMWDLAIICNSKAVVTNEPDAMSEPITYTTTTSLSAAEVPAVIETMTLGTVPASVISASAGTTQGQVTFTITGGAGGLEKLDLDGVLQMSGTWVANSNGLYDLESTMSVRPGTPTMTTHPMSSGSQGPISTTSGQATTATTVSGQTTTTTTVPAVTGQNTTATTVSGQTTTANTTSGQTTTATTVSGQTTTATTVSGQTTTATVSGQTTTVPGQTTTATTAPGQTTTATTVSGQTTTTTQTTTATSTAGPNTNATTTTKTTTTTTPPPKPTLDLVVNSTVDVNALTAALKNALGNPNANITVTCSATASGSTSKTCVVKFDSSSDSAIVKEKANSQEIPGVMSAAEPGSEEEGSDDDNTTVIIIVVVVAVVVLVGAVGAFIMVKKRGSTGTGQSFMDMEQEMALNDPQSQNGAITL
jgi:hypothetical protein